MPKKKEIRMCSLLMVPYNPIASIVLFCNLIKIACLFHATTTKNRKITSFPDNNDVTTLSLVLSPFTDDVFHHSMSIENVSCQCNYPTFRDQSLPNYTHYMLGGCVPPF